MHHLMLQQINNGKQFFVMLQFIIVKIVFGMQLLHILIVHIHVTTMFVTRQHRRTWDRLPLIILQASIGNHKEYVLGIVITVSKHQIILHLRHTILDNT